MSKKELKTMTKAEQAAAMVAELLPTVKKSAEAIEGIPVGDHEDYREICNVLFEVAELKSTVTGRVDELVAEEKATLLAVGTEVAPLSEAYEAHIADMKNRARDYAMECEERYAAMLAKAAKLAKSDPKKARELNARAEDELAPKVKGIAFVAKMTPKVLDQKKVPKEFYKLVLDEDKLSMAARDGVEVPGVVFEDVRTVRVTPGQREVK